MPDVDIEIKDAPADTGEYAYPMADELLVEGQRVGKGDLIHHFGDEKLDSSFEIVYGFGWGGIYTDTLTKVQMPKFTEWSEFIESIKSGEYQVVFLAEEKSYKTSDNRVETLSHYRNHHNNGWEPIMTKKSRDILDTRNELEYIKSYEDVREMFDAIYTPSSIENVAEANAMYELFIDCGYKVDSLSSPNDIISQTGLDGFTD